RLYQKNIKISPETEFWGHCSNLQAWTENEYDTRLLHSNLAFPLLKKLTESGDPLAKKVFKEEIAKRFMKGHLSVSTYLIKEGYLFYLSKEEFESILDSKAFSELEPNNKEAWENLGYLYSVNGEYDKAIAAYKHVVEIDSDNIRTWLNLGLIYRKKGEYDKAIESIKCALNINPNQVKIWRDFEKFLEEPYFLYLFLNDLSENLKKSLLNRLIIENNKNPDYTISNLLSAEFKNLEIEHIVYKGKIFEIKNNHLSLSNQNIEDITEIIGLGKLINLNSLSLHYNQISEIKGLENLYNLKELVLNSNQIPEIKGLENLKKLEKLDLKNNQINELKALENLRNLEYLNLPKNEIREIKGLDNLINLKQLVLNFNLITEVKGLGNLSHLEILDLRYNKINKIKGLKKLANLKDLYLSGNQISEIKGLEALKNLEVLDLTNTKISKIPNSLELLPSLKKIILINCHIDYYPESLSEILLNYTSEDRKNFLRHDLEYTYDDIEDFEKNSSKPALLGGKPLPSFKKWLSKEKGKEIK
ncbi:MAG: leucine-rich repeat domain-containing protein, partial [Promethearchaeota archaeon]